ncbi:MAG: hypothetical protein QXH92_03775 [Candidatus Aenigmatarchaeota archaeon]
MLILQNAKKRTLDHELEYEWSAIFNSLPDDPNNCVILGFRYTKLKDGYTVLSEGYPPHFSSSISTSLGLFFIHYYTAKTGDSYKPYNKAYKFCYKFISINNDRINLITQHSPKDIVVVYSKLKHDF